MKRIYCISGLGADEKAFSKLRIAGYELVHLHWLLPLKSENIENYATRMRNAITDDQPIIMGLSFGGMVGIEIAKQLPGSTVILISSVLSSKQIPYWMKLAGKLKINRVVPIKPYEILEPIQNHFIGATTSDEKAMVRAYRKNVSTEFLSWAVDQILNWQNDWQPAAIFQIHGNADHIFPIKRIHTDFVVKDAGHFMILNKAGEVSRYVNSILGSTEKHAV